MSAESATNMPAPGHRPRVVVSGTLAIDTLATYDGVFDRNAIRTESGLSMSMRLASLDERHGGCAMNVAWTLQQLGSTALPLVRAGRDFATRYAPHVATVGMDTSGIHVDPDAPQCSRCLVISDANGAQIVGWYGGPAADRWQSAGEAAGAFASRNRANLAIVAPDHAPAMCWHMDTLLAAGVPFLTDPGQGMPDFSEQDARAVISRSSELIVNAGELAVLLGLIKAPVEALAGQLDRLIVTRGREGIEVMEGAGSWTLPAAPPANVVDPTGAGDAFRAGWMHAWACGLAPVDRGRLGCTVASFAVEHAGPQEHHISASALRDRYRANWGTPLPATIFPVAPADVDDSSNSVAR